MKLLTLANTKTMKGEKLGYQTYILHLAPAKESGFNACPSASKGCAAACLYTAGRGRFDLTKKARIRKTREFFTNRETFMAQLVWDIKAAIRKSERENMIPVFRLNGTSDIRWENVAVTVDGIEYASVMEAFPAVKFYDYSKIPNRRGLPSNYSLTYSRSESNDANVAQWLKSGENVAVVFDTKKGDALPPTYQGYTVVDGDESDLRFLDPRNVVVGLHSKGDGKKDTSGFVVITRAA